MNNINICTNLYKLELLEWLKQNNLKYKSIEYDNKGKGCFVKIEYSKNFEDKVQFLLEEIVLIQNSITQNNLTIKDKIKKVVLVPCRKENIRKVSEFFKMHNMLNIEGYVNFRMNEYRHLINIVLYAFIKKHINFNRLN